MDDEELAEVFHRAWRKEVDLAPPWPNSSDKHRAGVIAGVRAVRDAAKGEIKPTLHAAGAPHVSTKGTELDSH